MASLFSGSQGAAPTSPTTVGLAMAPSSSAPTSRKYVHVTVNKRFDDDLATSCPSFASSTLWEEPFVS